MKISKQCELLAIVLSQPSRKFEVTLTLMRSDDDWEKEVRLETKYFFLFYSLKIKDEKKKYEKENLSFRENVGEMEGISWGVECASSGIRWALRVIKPTDDGRSQPNGDRNKNDRNNPTLKRDTNLRKEDKNPLMQTFTLLKSMAHFNFLLFSLNSVVRSKSCSLWLTIISICEINNVRSYRLHLALVPFRRVSRWYRCFPLIVSGFHQFDA